MEDKEIEDEKVESPDEDLAEAGRGTDTVMGHLSLGEVVIPRAFLDDPEVLQYIKGIFESNGADLAEFTVGDPANKINSETGYPEFFLKKLKKAVGSVIKNVVKPVAKLATTGGRFVEKNVPGGEFIVPALVTATTGPVGLAAYEGTKRLGETGNIGRSLKSAAVAGGGAYVGGQLGGAGSGSLGGLTDTALGRAVDSAYQGSALQGLYDGASGALGDLYNAGSSAVDGIYSGSGLKDVYTGASGAFDTASSGLDSLYQGSALQSGFKSGGDALKSFGIDTGGSTTSSVPSVGGGASSYNYSNLPEGFTLGDANIGGFDTGSVFDGISTAGNAVGENSGGIFEGVGSMARNYATPILSALLGRNANNKAEDALLAGAEANQALLAPYASGFRFAPGDLTLDPGYQFNLQEGQKAIDRRQLARGNYFSGGAGKELQEFGQGLADNTYNTAFNRALQGYGTGLTGALANAGVNTDMGNIRANSATNKGNLYSGALGALLGGDSFTNTGALQGGDDIQALLRRLNLGTSAYAG